MSVVWSGTVAHTNLSWWPAAGGEDLDMREKPFEEEM